MSQASRSFDPSTDRFLILGAGGLGCVVAAELVSRGVRHLTLVDHDRVDESNLSRQILFSPADVGHLKVEAARRALTSLAPGVRVHTVDRAFAPQGDADLVRDHHCVIDGTDRMALRFAVNDLCVRLRRSLVHGGAQGWRGQVLRIDPGQTPCLRCVFEGPPPASGEDNCARAGVVTPVVGVIGAWMVEEVFPSTSSRRSCDARLRVLEPDGRARDVSISPDPRCLVCTSI